MVFIAGRTDDVLNLGGVKVSTFDLEQQILQVPGVQDVAIFATSDVTGDALLVAAVVITPSTTIDAVRGRIRGLAQFRMSLAQLPALPRNDMGKVARKELEAALVAAGVLGNSTAKAEQRPSIEKPAGLNKANAAA